MKDVEGLLDSCTILLDVQVRNEDPRFQLFLFYFSLLQSKPRGCTCCGQNCEMPEPDSIIKTDMSGLRC